MKDGHLVKLQKIHKDQFDLKFIHEIKENDENQDDIVEEKIIREVYKTKKEKFKDFQNMDPNIIMTNGGANDVYQAVI